MRLMFRISLLLLPLTACMTQHDQTVWNEFKAEMNGNKTEETGPTADASAAAAKSEVKSDEAEAVKAPSKN